MSDFWKGTAEAATSNAGNFLSTLFFQRQNWKREDTAVQRRYADMKAAGINPILAAGSPAQSAQTQAPQIDANIGERTATYMGNKLLREEIEGKSIANQGGRIANIESAINAQIAQKLLDRQSLIDEQLSNDIESIKKDIQSKGVHISQQEKELLSTIQEYDERKRNINIYKDVGAPSDHPSTITQQIAEANSMLKENAPTTVRRNLMTGGLDLAKTALNEGKALVSKGKELIKSFIDRRKK